MLEARELEQKAIARELEQKAIARELELADILVYPMA